MKYFQSYLVGVSHRISFLGEGRALHLKQAGDSASDQGLGNGEVVAHALPVAPARFPLRVVSPLSDV